MLASQVSEGISTVNRPTSGLSQVGTADLKKVVSLPPCLFIGLCSAIAR